MTATIKIGIRAYGEKAFSRSNMEPSYRSCKPAHQRCRSSRSEVNGSQLRPLSYKRRQHVVGVEMDIDADTSKGVLGLR